MRKYGCFDRKPLRELAVVADGWVQDSKDTRKQRIKVIADPTTKHCNYALTELGRVDPLCLDCVHKEANDVA